MGMTDRQFVSYQSMLLRRLELALEEAKQGNDSVKLKQLEMIIEDLRSELKRP